MSIKTAEELAGMRAAGRIAREVREAMKKQVRPGVTTAQLDEIGERVMKAHGARSAPAIVYGFPGANLISVNEEAVHGIPGDRALREGDLVKLDVTVEKDGFIADTAETVAVGTISQDKHRLMACAKRALHKALRIARTGTPIAEIGRVVESEVQRNGFSVMRELSGHGIGRTIHEPPTIPNFYEAHNREILTEGLVITIEPIIASGKGYSRLERDGWTICTADRSLSAHFEHTLVIQKQAPLLLTA